MKTRKFPIIVVILISIRMIISLVISDGKVRSDSLTYVGLAVNIIEHGNFTAIVPVNESEITNGMSVDSLYRYHSASDSQLRRLMNYQWLHCLVYAPVLILFKSLYAVIIVNNLLFAWTGLLLLGMVRNTIEETWQLTAYAFFLLFPPFFYITNQFLTEPLFIFLLAVISTALIRNEKIGPAVIIALIALSITRGFGLFLLAGYLAICVGKQQYRSAVLVALCGFISITINHVAAASDPDPSRIIIPSPPPLMHTVYFANTVHGNGDSDFFLAYPEAAVRDTFFQSYKNSTINSGDVVKGLFYQNFSDPKRSFTLILNRATAYFLNIIPDSWNYLGTPPQPLYRKILWGIQNIFILVLIFGGLKMLPDQYRIYYRVLFVISFIVHFISIARYRYFFPALVLGLPAIAAAFQYYLRNGLARVFKKQNAPR